MLLSTGKEGWNGRNRSLRPPMIVAISQMYTLGKQGGQIGTRRTRLSNVNF
jgi:hypothetical protein